MKAAALLLLLCASVATADNARLVSSLTSTGWTKILDTAVPILEAKFAQASLPDVTGETKVKVLGDVTYQITNIAISGLKIPSGTAVMQEGGIGVKLSGITVQVSADFKYRKVHWPHISDHGTLSVVPQGGVFDVTVGLADSEGHLQVATEDEDVAFQSYDIHISSKASWLYDLIKDLFKNKIRDTLNSEISKEVASLINSKGNSILASLPETVQVGGGESRVDMNVALASSPLITSAATTVRDTMEIEPLTGTACPLAPHNLPNTTAAFASEDIQLFVDQSLLNCALWAEHSQGGFHHTITDSDIPSEIALRLDTKSWSQFFPKLGQVYPTNKNMTIQVTTATAPEFNMQANGEITANAFLNLNFSVLFSATDSIPVYTLGASILFGADASMKSGNGSSSLHADLKILQVNMSVVSSDIGTLNVTKLYNFVHAITPVAEGALNQAFAKGFPLPTVKGVTFTDAKLVISHYQLAIGTSFDYTAPSGSACDISTPEPQQVTYPSFGNKALRGA